MYDNIFSVITIKETQTRFKMRRPWLIYLGLGILSILITSQITGLGRVIKVVKKNQTQDDKSSPIRARFLSTFSSIAIELTSH